MSEASAQGQISEGHQHATNPPVSADESIVDVDSVQNNDTGNGGSTIDVGSAEGNPVNNVQNSDGGAVVQPDAVAGGVQADAGGGGGRAAPAGDTKMRCSRSFEEQYVMEKRGWMMMVAALFVQMAFQAALQPPTWIPADWFQQMLSYKREHGAVPPAPSTITSAPSPSPHYAPAESPAGSSYQSIILTKDQAHRVWVYVVFNTLSFATALTILVTLLLTNRSCTRRLISVGVPVFFVVLALSCSATFALANSYEKGLMKDVITIIAVYALLTFFACIAPSCAFFTVLKRVTRRLSSRRPERNKDQAISLLVGVDTGTEGA